MIGVEYEWSGILAIPGCVSVGLSLCYVRVRVRRRGDEVMEGSLGGGGGSGDWHGVPVRVWICGEKSGFLSVR